MSSILKTPTKPKFYLRLLSVNSTLELPSPYQLKSETQTSKATCHYESTVYACCGSPYSTFWPPQLRHVSPCSFVTVPRSSPTKFICPNFSPTPRILEIMKDCETCVKKHGRYGHGGFINARDTIKDGEWVLLRDDGGKEKWMRIKREGWREWYIGKRERSDCEVVIRVDEGVDEGEWVLLR